MATKQVEERKFNVYADLKDGLGVRKVTKHPVTRDKADNEAGRLLKGETQASRAYVIPA